MDKATIELTKEEAQLIAQLLPQVPISGTVASAQSMMRLAIQVDGVIKKIAAAFGEVPPPPPAEPVNGNGAAPVSTPALASGASVFQPKRKRK